MTSSGEKLTLSEAIALYFPPEPPILKANDYKCCYPDQNENLNRVPAHLVVSVLASLGRK